MPAFGLASRVLRMQAGRCARLSDDCPAGAACFLSWRGPALPVQRKVGRGLEADQSRFGTTGVDGAVYFRRWNVGKFSCSDGRVCIALSHRDSTLEHYEDVCRSFVKVLRKLFPGWKTE